MDLHINLISFCAMNGAYFYKSSLNMAFICMNIINAGA